MYALGVQYSLTEYFLRAPKALLNRSLKLALQRAWVADALVPCLGELSPEEVQSRGYFSQTGQDFFLDQIVFRGRTHGTFVDVGAHSGKLFSNTYFFERFRSWTGLCVEPNPELLPKLRSNRSCDVEGVAIGKMLGETEFVHVEGADMLSGFPESMNLRHRSRIRREVRNANGRTSQLRVPTVPLQQLLESRDLKNVDLLSVDTEGSELEVLQSLDFEKVHVSVILVERNFESKGVFHFLTKQGLKRVFRIGWDDVYLNPGNGSR